MLLTTAIKRHRGSADQNFFFFFYADQLNPGTCLTKQYEQVSESSLQGWTPAHPSLTSAGDSGLTGRDRHGNIYCKAFLIRSKFNSWCDDFYYILMP